MEKIYRNIEMNKIKDRPYFSVVIPSRNDSYSEDMLKKFTIGLSTLINQLNYYKIKSEIIIVEWNPPRESRKLSDELFFFKNLHYCVIRIITVDPVVHNRYVGFKKKSIAVSVAFNTGIRRAKGLFITTKAADTFYSDDLIKYISNKKLEYDKVYRADRVDVKFDIKNFDEQWQYQFEKNKLYRGTYNNTGPHAKACGDFMLMNKESWHKVRGFHEPKTVIALGEDAEALYAAIGTGLKQICLTDSMCVYKLSHEKQYNKRIKNNEQYFSNFLRKIFKLLNNSFSIIGLEKIFIFLIKFFLGIFNLPTTKVLGLKVRSHYRVYVVLLLRYKFRGLNFLGNKNWGLKSIELEETLIKK